MTNDVIRLISKPLPDSPTVRRDVFAEVLPVKRTEFYKSKSIGILPEVTFRVFKYDYENEVRVEHGGKLFALIRAYAAANQEKVELTCAGIELSQKNCKISINSRIVGKDEGGYPKITHEEIAVLYAFKEEVRGREKLETSGTFPERTVVFRFEKPDFEITTDNDIIMDGIVHDIQGIIEILGREEFIEVSTVTRGLYGR
jgi:head-tail adaptor